MYCDDMKGKLLKWKSAGYIIDPLIFDHSEGDENVKQ